MGRFVQSVSLRPPRQAARRSGQRRRSGFRGGFRFLWSAGVDGFIVGASSVVVEKNAVERTSRRGEGESLSYRLVESKQTRRG